MDKQMILKKLRSSIFDKNEIIIVSGASLVAQKVINKTSDIDLACSKEYYDSLNLPTKIGALGYKIKFVDVFEIGYNLYFPNDVIDIDGFNFLKLDKCLEIKKRLNREKDKEAIVRLENILYEKNNL